MVLYASKGKLSIKLLTDWIQFWFVGSASESSTSDAIWKITYASTLGPNLSNVRTVENHL